MTEPAEGRSGGNRDTAQRRAVLEVLHEASDHPTAADIHERVRAVLPGVGAATIYRTLHMLVDTGAARELRLNDETVIRYDANIERHDHLVCEGCGSVVDVSPPVPFRPPASLSAQTGFQITGHELRLMGLCSSCRTSAATMPTNTTTTTTPTTASTSTTTSEETPWS